MDWPRATPQAKARKNPADVRYLNICLFFQELRRVRGLPAAAGDTVSHPEPQREAPSEQFSQGFHAARGFRSEISTASAALKLGQPRARCDEAGQMIHHTCINDLGTCYSAPNICSSLPGGQNRAKNWQAGRWCDWPQMAVTIAMIAVLVISIRLPLVPTPHHCSPRA